MRNSIKRCFALGAVAASIAAMSGLAGSATADSQVNPTTYVAAGSDTTQEVMNALAGFSNKTNYTPVNSGSPSYAQFVSIDATPPGVSYGTSGYSAACITPVQGAATFTRPNGSGGGRKALAASYGFGYRTATVAGENSNWQGINAALNSVTPGAETCGDVGINGAVQIARSSGTPTAAGNQVASIPFARDAVTVAYVSQNTTAADTPKTSFSKAELADLFTNGPRVIGGKLIIPCDINTLSGTRSFFGGGARANVAVMQSSPATVTPSTVNGACQAVVSPSSASAPLEENTAYRMTDVLNAQLTTLTGAGTAYAGFVIPTAFTNAGAATYPSWEAIVPHSISAYVAQGNGAAPPLLPGNNGGQATGTWPVPATSNGFGAASFGIGSITDAGSDGVPAVTSTTPSNGETTPAVTSGVGATGTLTFASTPFLVAGDTVVLSGFTPAGWNGTFTVATAPTSTTVTIPVPGGTTDVTILGTVTVNVTTSSTIPVANRRFYQRSAWGRYVYNILAQDVATGSVTNGPTLVKCDIRTSTLAPVSLTASGTTGTITFAALTPASAQPQLQVGQSITLAGFSPAGYNGVALPIASVVATTPANTTYTLTLPSALGNATVTAGTSVVSATTAPACARNDGTSTDITLLKIFRSNPGAAIGTGTKTIPANYTSPVCLATATIAKFGYVNIDAATNGSTNLALCGTIQQTNGWDTVSSTHS